MKILILNQTFYPDVAATAQHATDLALDLTEHGHEVTVVAGRKAYGRKDGAYPAQEIWEGIHIRRVGSLALGKSTRWGRALNFASFLSACLFRLAVSPRFDVVVAMTSPPMIGFLAALFTRSRSGKLVHWVMDLNPDEATAAGWLRAGAPLTRIFEWALSWSLRQASHVVVLDRFMKDRIEAKIDTRDPPTTVIIPPGARDQAVRFNAAGRDTFRQLHGLTGKFVIMYSGNHSPCHPLDTLLGAAERLRSDPRFAFCFVGGGSRFETVRQFANSRRLGNILTLPYQPEESLSASLSAADLHVVVMGDPFVGIVHPSKIYNALTLGIPILYVGPSESHITDLAPAEANGRWFFPALHGDVDRVVEQIASARGSSTIGEEDQLEVAGCFSQRPLLDRLSAHVVEKRPPAPGILESRHARVADKVEETVPEPVSAPAEPAAAFDGADSGA